MTVRMKEKTESFVIHYPDAVNFADEQIKILWTHNEIKVDKDIHDILTNFSESEKHATITGLKLFTLYELKAGADYWCGRYMRTYKRPELLRMAATFGMFELAIHKPFYNKINEALHLNTDEFYTSYVKDPILKDRMDFIDKAISDKDDLFSVAIFSMVEGAVLYSNFAFFKHFQSKGKNKILNVVRGMNFTVRDENCLDAATEVMTINGWKNIKNVTLDDSVLLYEPTSKQYVYGKPTNIVKTQSNEAYSFKNEYFEQRVTPNHRMITIDGEVLAKDANISDKFVISQSVSSSLDNNDTDKEFMLRVISGNVTDVEMNTFLSSLSKERASNALKFYLSKMS